MAPPIATGAPSIDASSDSVVNASGRRAIKTQRVFGGNAQLRTMSMFMNEKCTSVFSIWDTCKATNGVRVLLTTTILFI